MTSESPGISEKQLINLLKNLSSAGDLKIVIIDSGGNVISDISLSALRDALLDNVKGAYRLGIKDLTVDSNEILDIPSGVEFAVNDLTINGRMRVKGTLDVYGDLDVIGRLDVIGEVNVGV